MGLTDGLRAEGQELLDESSSNLLVIQLNK